MSSLLLYRPSYIPFCTALPRTSRWSNITAEKRGLGSFSGPGRSTVRSGVDGLGYVREEGEGGRELGRKREGGKESGRKEEGEGVRGGDRRRVEEGSVGSSWRKEERRCSSTVWCSTAQSSTVR